MPGRKKPVLPMLLAAVLVVAGVAGLVAWLAVPVLEALDPKKDHAVPLAPAHARGADPEAPGPTDPAPRPGATHEGTAPSTVAPSTDGDPRLERLADAAARVQALARAAASAAEAPPPPPPSFPATRDGIRAAMQTALPAMKECFEAWLQVNPDVGGQVAVAFRIEPDPDGDAGAAVRDAHVTSGGLGTMLLDGCVVAAVGELQFSDVPAEGLAVTYPFRFTATQP